MSRFGKIGQAGSSLIETLEQEIAMYRCDIRVNNPVEALIFEQALAMYRERGTLLKSYKDGTGKKCHPTGYRQSEGQ